ncbi:hypothetical protein ACA30_05445 [Virgibacillus soli]|uniref:Uncharacterized protein n=1 Tax=Lederbergia galactosidilytica TaxID=217031 RepID=A0A0Q9YJ72_9BACI|nr:hypothetical protein ACA30_05445 [Virgibacillus soli]KRG16791.1 hypothetical protein ACA29_03510 [Lederbergia galactosidilytica]OAK74726.1 hypothetical protein ABB05_03945 [Lederbergia galactosidilytica]
MFRNNKDTVLTFINLGIDLDKIDTGAGRKTFLSELIHKLGFYKFLINKKMMELNHAKIFFK